MDTVKQIIDNKYVILVKLVALLNHRFGQGKYSCQYTRGRFLVESPEGLTQDEIESCCDDYDDDGVIDSAAASHSSSKSKDIVESALIDDLPGIPIVPSTEDTLIVHDVQLNDANYVLSMKRWSGYNSDEKGGSGRGYRNISKGYTSDVFEVDAVVAKSTDDKSSAEMKLAVKRLKNKTSDRDFLQEYRKLRAVARTHHPNIVTLFAAFKYEENNTISRNLVFPLSIGSLKTLFNGLMKDISLAQWEDSLWGQFEGLADALRCLHDQCSMAHGDIKASNILLYERQGNSGLVAQIADFGLAKDLEKSTPEYIKRLRDNDMWCLGIVFAELLTYILLDSRGLQRFRSLVLASYDQVISDEFEDPRFDHSGVRSEVIEWLTQITKDNQKALEVARVTISILNTADTVSSAADVTALLLETSTAPFFDGRRTVCFIRPSTIPEPSLFDKARATVENLVGAPISWWPAPPVQYKCPPGSTRIKWRWCAHDLYVDLPTDLVRAYKENSCKSLSSLSPGCILPQFTTTPRPLTTTNPGQPSFQNTSTQNAASISGGQPSGTGSSGVITTLASQSRAPNDPSQIYWCVDKAWIEPAETWLCIENSHHMAGDRALCSRLRELYTNVRGIRGRLLSWKTCLGIKFTSFNRLYDRKDQVICMGIGLPKPPEYQYTLFQPELVHMAIASRQILAGMHDPSKVDGNNTLEMIPKKVDAFLEQHKGAEGWGLLAVQGWSLYKIVLWMGAFTIIGLVFVVLWLVLVDPKDLQNAFTPGMFLAAMLCLAVGIPQFLDAA